MAAVNVPVVDGGDGESRRGWVVADLSLLFPFFVFSLLPRIKIIRLGERMMKREWEKVNSGKDAWLGNNREGVCG
jgi:hypothetical protein